MRRILAAAVLGAALFTASACADEPAGTTATPSGSAAAATSAAASPAGPVDRKAACDQYKAAETAAQTAATTAIPKLLAAGTDKTKVDAAVAEIVAAFGGFQTQLSAAATTAAGDAELKAAIDEDIATLKTALTSAAAANGDAEKVQAAFSTPEFEKAGEKVKTLCAA